MEVDPKVEIKWLEKRLEDIQKGMLKAQNVDLPEAERIVGRIKEAIDYDSKAVGELKARLIRLQAMREEEMSKETNSEADEEKNGEKE